MAFGIDLLVAVMALAALAALAIPALRAWRLYRGTRIVTCPETRRPVAVELKPGIATAGSLVGEPILELRSCTRWPERRNCGQECVHQIEQAPADCLVRGMLERWYEGKRCAVCRKPVDHRSWHAHRPAVIAVDGTTYDWEMFPPEAIPQIMATHRPVCWNCHIAEMFRRKFPDLVVDRPPAADQRPHPGH
jgi:hypothetical protein